MRWLKTFHWRRRIHAVFLTTT